MLVLTVLALATALAPASAATVTSLLNPTPLTSGAGAASTQLAGESPLTRTRVNFPTMLDWWVVGAPNQVEWDFVEPDADASDVSLHVVLDNLDKTLCPQPVRVNGDEVVRAHWSGWGNANTLKGAKPGTYYFLQLQDATNTSRIYAESENFELRPAGSAPTLAFEIPADPSSAPPSATSAPAAQSQSQSQSQSGAGGATSSAGRLAPAAWIVGAAVLAVGVWR